MCCHGNHWLPAHGSVAPSLWDRGVEEEEWTLQRSSFFRGCRRSGPVLWQPPCCSHCPPAAALGDRGNLFRVPLSSLSWCRSQGFTQEVESGLRCVWGGAMPALFQFRRLRHRGIPATNPAETVSESEGAGAGRTQSQILLGL